MGNISLHVHLTPADFLVVLSGFPESSVQIQVNQGNFGFVLGNIDERSKMFFLPFN